MPSLEKISWQLRLDILDMIYKSGSGHIGGSLSSLDLIVATYFSKLFNFPLNTKTTSRDHFILSAGHLAPALYAVLSYYGYFPRKLLDSYSQLGSPLQSHISTSTPGVDFSAGLLGQGLSFAAGLALGDKRHRVICLSSDGEHDEGQTWEAIMFAAKYNLKNLINIVDHNKYQIDGSNDAIMPLGDLAEKYSRFGWTVYQVDGHNLTKLITTLKKAKLSTSPTCIIAHTTIGRGISYMQYDYHYHDVKNLSPSLYQLAKSEIQKHL